MIAILVAQNLPTWLNKLLSVRHRRDSSSRSWYAADARVLGNADGKHSIPPELLAACPDMATSPEMIEAYLDHPQSFTQAVAPQLLTEPTPTPSSAAMPTKGQE